MTDEDILELARGIVDSFIEHDIIPKDYEYDIIVAREIIYNKVKEYLNDE